MKRMKILLCVSPYERRVGVGSSYFSFFSLFGEVVLVSSDSDIDTFVEMGDVLALPGGADVDPKRYGEAPSVVCGSPNQWLEQLDTTLLPKWLSTGKPIIGICRGLQTLNVACGGTLWQDIWHHKTEDRTWLGHKLYTDIPGWEIVDTNSLHHQGIKKLAPDFEEIGWTLLDPVCATKVKNTHYKHKWIKKEDKLVKSKMEYGALAEVIRHKKKPYVAFQYHPEDFNCPFAIQLIEQVCGLKVI